MRFAIVSNVVPAFCHRFSSFMNYTVRVSNEHFLLNGWRQESISCFLVRFWESDSIGILSCIRSIVCG